MTDPTGLTTRILSVSIPVADQDRALRFYCDVLGCRLVQDQEVWPGARLVEVAVPGSEVTLMLLAADGEIPVAVRLATADAGAAHDALSNTPGCTPLDDVLTYDFAPPMFRFTDVDGNLLIYLQDTPDEPGTPPAGGDA